MVHKAAMSQPAEQVHGHITRTGARELAQLYLSIRSGPKPTPRKAATLGPHAAPSTHQYPPLPYSTAVGSAPGGRDDRTRALGDLPSTAAGGGWSSSMRGPRVSVPLTSLADGTSSPCSVAS